MGVYGKRCLGLVKEGCKGSVRLEVSPSIPMSSVKLTGSTRTCSYTTSFSSTDICSMARRPSPKSGVQLDMVSHCPSYSVPADIHQKRSLLTIGNQATLSTLVTAVDKYLDRNGRRFVDMKGLFGFMEKLRL
jgi:DNA polymerase alpha subunit A